VDDRVWLKLDQVLANPCASGEIVFDEVVAPSAGPRLHRLQRKSAQAANLVNALSTHAVVNAPHLVPTRLEVES
jgi:hypothetical protein